MARKAQTGWSWTALAWGALALLLLPGWFAPAVARAQGAGADTLALTWTAPGDDGSIGTATGYELRMSPLPIDEATWTAGTIVPGAPVPLPAGSPQRMVVRGLVPGTTYFFAIRSVDEAGNWSAISNVVRWDGLDTAPPSAPTGVSAGIASGGGVRVAWAPNPEADLAGYSVYRGVAAAGPFAPLSGSLVTAAEYLDAVPPPGVDTVWYQVTARDLAGNESARSASAMALLAAPVSGWTMEAGYPNPSGAGTSVRIPLVVPGPGGDARVEIVNSIGQRVRTLDLGARPPGPTDVVWDGRNDAGREVAPGVYTAWLIAGPARASVRLVRVP